MMKLQGEWHSLHGISVRLENVYFVSLQLKPSPFSIAKANSYLLYPTRIICNYSSGPQTDC